MRFLITFPESFRVMGCCLSVSTLKRLCSRIY